MINLHKPRQELGAARSMIRAALEHPLRTFLWLTLALFAIRPALEMEFESSRLKSSGLVFANLAPEPPGLEQVRKALAEQAKRRAEQAEAENRSEAQRK